ncbi:MAG: hypothetical protein IT512_03030 [Rhodocyclaceae bacterium]|nr:hypothetical protein [Rhodocyclaceae bacterium]
MLSPEFLKQAAEAKTPDALATLIYRLCAPLAGVRKIDLICNEKHEQKHIACFIETPSLSEARRLAQHLGVTVFGEQGLVFELPRPDGFRCAPYVHPGDPVLPVRVAFSCLVR